MLVAEEMRASMLRVEGLDAGYGALTVLRDVSLHVDSGEIVAVIGANGAGKSTLLKTISGLLQSSKGQILLDGRDVTRLPAHRIVSLGIAQVPEGRQVFAELTVEDNLQLGAFAWSKSPGSVREDMGRVYELFPRLEERRRQFAGTLSGGEQQMLAIGRALMARPKLLLLDEPSLGLAPIMVRTIFEAVLGLKQANLAIVLVEQNARAALAMADRAYVLETGRVVAQGAGRDLLQDPQVRESYLGQGLSSGAGA